MLKRAADTMGFKYQYYLLPNPNKQPSNSAKFEMLNNLMGLLDNRTVDALVRFQVINLGFLNELMA